MASSRATEDWSTRGFLAEPPDPLRYMAAYRDTWETTGMLCSRIPTGARVLDVGCGTGSISLLLKNECQIDLVGVEPDERRVAACLSRGLTVECGYYDEPRAERLGAFDVIVFADVLEHVPDPASLLELAARNLSPGGRIIASVPNVAHWTVRSALLRGRFDYQSAGIMDATHLRWFTIDGIQRLFEAVGLDVVNLDWTSGEWMPAYQKMPWRLIPSSRKGGLLRRLVRASPALYACQHIVTAQRSFST